MKALVMVTALIWLVPKLFRLATGQPKREYYLATRVMSPTTRLVIGVVVLVFAVVVIKG